MIKFFPSNFQLRTSYFFNKLRLVRSLKSEVRRVFELHPFVLRTSHFSLNKVWHYIIDRLSVKTVSILLILTLTFDGIIVPLQFSLLKSFEPQTAYAASANWDFNGGANGTGDSNIVNPSSTIKLKPDWYYTNYQKRQLLTVNATDAVSSGYSVKTDLDLTGMIDSSLLRPDLNDLRIGAYDRTDGRFETVAGADDASRTGLDRDVIKGQSMFFDGNGDYINLNNALLSTTDGLKPYTIEAWIKTSTGDAIVTQYSTSSNSNRFGLRVIGGKLQYWKGGIAIATSTISVNDNQWHHVTATKDSSGNIKLYVDGQLDGSGSDTNPFESTNTHIAMFGTSTAPYTGIIDEVRISDTVRTIPSTPRQAAFISDSNTVGLWHLDNDAGDSAAGNNGTLNGSPYYTEGRVIKGVGTSQISTGENGLNGLWRMNGTLGSISNGASIPAAAGSNGTASNANGTGMAYQNGKLNEAINFDGVDDFISMPTLSANTIEMWVKPSSTQNKTYPTYYNQNAQQTASGYWWVYTSGAGSSINWQYTNGSAIGTLSWANAITYDTWNHLAFAFDNTNKTVTFYKNGVSLGTQSASGALLPSGTFYTGTYQGATSDYPVNGQFDELNIHNRLLTASEIAEHFNSKSEVWFKTLSNISASSTSEASGQHSYYAYYNYASAGAPPENKSNVYAFSASFESGMDGFNPGTRVTSLAFEGGYSLQLPGGYSVGPPTTWPNRPFILETKMYLPSGGGSTETQLQYGTNMPAISAGNPTSGKWGYFNSSGVWTNSNVDVLTGSWTNVKMQYNANNTYSVWQNDNQIISNQGAATYGSGDVLRYWGPSTAYIDAIRIRAYTTNEPTITNGTETGIGTSNAYLTPGVWTSNAIGNTNLYDWGTLTVTKTTPGASTLTVDVLRASDSAVLATNVATGTDLNVAGVSNAEKSIRLRANLAGGADSPTLSTLSLGYSYETDPPTNPTNLSVSAASTTSNSLSWTASTDTESGVAGYKVERAPDVSGSPGNFAQIDTSATNSYTDSTGLSVNTKYWYRVRAYDNATNNSNYNDYTSRNIYSDPASAWIEYKDGLFNLVQNDTNIYAGQYGGGGSYYWYRHWLKFDLSAVGKIIDSATLNVKTGMSYYSGGTAPQKVRVDHMPDFGASVDSSDWSTAALSSNIASDTWMTSSTPTDTWKTLTISNYLQSDVNNNRPFSAYKFYGHLENTDQANYFLARLKSEETTGSTEDPYLTVNYSVPVSVTTLANTPTSPSATAASTTEINPISWISGGVQDHYHVYSSSDGYATPIHNSIATSTNQTGLSANTQYTYRIYGVNSADANSSTYATVSKYTKIQSPTGGSFGTVIKNSIDLSAAGTLSNLATGTSGLYFENTTSATNSGWTQTNSWSNSGLSPNTSYTYQVTSRNAESAANTAVAAGSKYTLPADSNVTADKTTSTWYNTTDVIFTNAAGFGAGGVQYYRYVFDQNPTYLSWNDTETQWTTGTLTKTASANGSWYLHVKSYNAENAAGTTADYGPYYYDGSPPTDPSSLTVGSVTTTSVPLSWTASTDSGGSTLAGYKIERAPDVSGSPGTFAQIATSATNSWTDNSTNNPTSPPAANTKYWYKVRAYDNATTANNSNYTSNVSATTLANLPINPVAIAASTSQIDISWTSGGSQDHYHVYSSSDSYLAPIYNSTTAATNQTTLLANTQYTYRVYGVNSADVNSSTYATVSKYTLSATPSITADKTASTWYNTTDVIFTNAASFGSTGVQYYRYVFDQNAAHTFDNSETQWSASTLTRTASANGSWYLHVKSFNGDNVANGTQTYGPYYYDGTVPSDPTGLSATAASTTQINLSWSGSTDSGGSNLTGYKIERAPDSSGSPGTFSQIDTSATNSYSDSGLSDNTKYWYRVRSYDNATNNSGYSSNASATTPSAVADPSTPSIASSKNTTSWHNSSSISFSPNTAFDNNGLAYYRYALSQVSSRLVLSSDSIWNSGDLTLPVSTSGIYYLHIKAYNASNTASSQVTYGPYHFDLEKPSVEIISHTSGDYVKGKIKLQAKANDNVGIAEVSFYDNSLDNKISSSAEAVFDTSKYKKGTRTLYAKAIDNAGNQAVSTIVLNIDNIKPEPVKPEVPAIDKSKGENKGAIAKVAKGQSIKIYFKVSDNQETTNVRLKVYKRYGRKNFKKLLQKTHKIRAKRAIVAKLYNAIKKKKDKTNKRKAKLLKRQVNSYNRQLVKYRPYKIKVIKIYRKQVATNKKVYISYKASKKGVYRLELRVFDRANNSSKPVVRWVEVQ